MRRHNPAPEEELLYGGKYSNIERQRHEPGWRNEKYDPEQKDYSYGEFKDDPQGEFITSNYWTGSDYSGSFVEKSNHKELLEQFGKLPGVHELSGDMGTYGLVFHVPTVMTWDESPRTTLIEILRGLEGYSLIDEEAHSMMEFEAQTEAWDDWARSDFEREIAKAYDFDSIEVLDADAFVRFFEKARERANEYWEAESGGNVYIRLERIVDKMTDPDIGLLLRDKVIEVVFNDDDERTAEEYLALVPPADVPGQTKMFGANPRGRASRANPADYPWVREHGADYDVPDEIQRLADAGLATDASWHNDTSPHFEIPGRNGYTVGIWVDHPDPDQRELGGTKRFGVEVTNPSGSMKNDGFLFQTDDAQEAVRFAQQAAGQTWRF